MGPNRKEVLPMNDIDPRGIQFQGNLYNLSLKALKFLQSGN